MKLTSVLLVTNMALTLAACSGDNNEPTLPAEELSTANSGKSTVAATVTPDQSLSPSTSAAVDDTPTPTPTPTSIPASTPRQAPTSAPVIATEPPESFARCQTCHTTNEGGANNLGPNLFGVYGKPAGVHADFNYSPALKDSGLVWNETNLDKWLENPRDLVPGNRMSFPGIKDESVRKALIDWMKQNR